MAHVLRLSVRRVQGSLRRRFSSSFAQDCAAEEAHAAETTATWKKISLFGAIPGCMLVAYNAVQKEKEHAAHGRPTFVAYSHLRIRAKPFPWGDGNHSLIHNAHANALPDGYEEHGDHAE